MSVLAEFEFKAITIIILISVIRSEPACSKYDYEEKLLSKVIRMEIKVENMEKTVKQSENDISEWLSSFEETRETAFHEFAKDLDEFKATVLGNVKAELDVLTRYRNEVKAELEDLEAMKKNITWVIETALEDVRDQIHVPTVYFAARSPANMNPSAQDEKFRFQTVLANVREGYNNQTGIFTALVSGMYAFSLQVCAYNKHVFPAIVKENAVLVPIRFNGADGSCSSSTVYTQMYKGERVWVHCTVCSTMYGAWEHSIAAWNLFTGVLIHN